MSLRGQQRIGGTVESAIIQGIGVSSSRTSRMRKIAGCG